MIVHLIGVVVGTVGEVVVIFGSDGVRRSMCWWFGRRGMCWKW